MSKNHRLRFAGFLLLVFTILGLSTVSAADTLDQQPLFKMLARIPNMTMSRSEIYFNDRKAVEAAYPSARMPKDWAEFKAMSDARGQNPDLIPVDIWWRVWRNQSTALTARYMNASKDSPLVVGFDYFQIEQEMAYGTPPDQTVQLAGSFFDEAVRTAFSLRGYTQQEENTDVELWCPEAGCEAGNKLNPSDIDLANPFGGNLGRSQSLLMVDGALISSASSVAMNSHIDVATDKADSLADLPQYRAVVEALSSDGVILQTSFLDGELLLQMNSLSPASLIFGERTTPELVKQYYQDMLEDYKTLPVYQLLAFADVASETSQIGEVTLVYNTNEDAQAAADALGSRIDSYVSVVVKQNLKKMLADRRVEKPKIKVVESSGKFVVVVSFATPKATAEQVRQFDVTSPVQPDVTPPGLVYRLLSDALMRRDLGWLSTIPRSEIEALAK